MPNSVIMRRSVTVPFGSFEEGSVVTGYSQSQLNLLIESGSALPIESAEGGELVRATTGPGGGVEVLSNGERLRDERSVEIMRQEYNLRKKGRVGVGGKAAIALRFDDWQNAMSSTVRPLLLARALPFSLVLISRWQTATSWGTSVTPAQLRDWVAYGAEIFAHGLDHQDYIGYDGLFANVVGSKTEIESLLPGVRVQGFSVPGIDTSYGTAENPSSPVTPEQRGSQYPYDRLSQEIDWYGPAGRLLMSHYALVESDSGPVRLPICSEPNLCMYGRAHLGLDHVTLSQALAAIDQAIREKCSLRLMGHAGNFGTPGKMSVADFTALLDYIVSKRDAGELEVVMPSSLPYVTSSTQRLDLMNGEGNLVGAENTTLSGWYKLGGTNNLLVSSGGHNDLPYFQMNAAGDYIANPSYLVADATRQGLAGESFVFEGWARSAGAGNTSARVDVQVANTTWTVGKTTVVGAEWTRVRFPFTLPTVGPLGEMVGTVSIKPSRYGGDGVQWSDMTAHKI